MSVQAASVTPIPAGWSSRSAVATHAMRQRTAVLRGTSRPATRRCAWAGHLLPQHRARGRCPLRRRCARGAPWARVPALAGRLPWAFPWAFPGTPACLAFGPLSAAGPDAGGRRDGFRGQSIQVTKPATASVPAASTSGWENSATTRASPGTDHRTSRNENSDRVRLRVLDGVGVAFERQDRRGCRCPGWWR